MDVTEKQVQEAVNILQNNCRQRQESDPEGAYCEGCVLESFCLPAGRAIIDL